MNSNKTFLGRTKAIRTTKGLQKSFLKFAEIRILCKQKKRSAMCIFELVCFIRYSQMIGVILSFITYTSLNLYQFLFGPIII